MGAYVDGKPFSVELVAAVSHSILCLILVENPQVTRR